MEHSQSVESRDDRGDRLVYEALRGRRLLVTGAGSGIGLDFLRMALGAGADAVAVTRDLAEAGHLEAALQQSGLSAAAILAGDLTDPDWCAGVGPRAADAMGGLDGVLSGAGIFAHQTSAETSVADWRAVLDINLTAGFVLARNAVPLMPDGGSMVFISSQIGTVGHRRAAAYTAAKAGVNGLTRALALEHASRNIRVNAVGPGPIATPMTQTARHDPERYRRLIETIPLGRFGQPAEVAVTAAFLLSNAASFITGQIIYIDGGILAA